MFNGAIADEIKTRDKLFKNLKNKIIIRQNTKTVFNKKRAFCENKLNEYIGKPKDIWKVLKSLLLHDRIFYCEVKTLKINNTLEHDFNSALYLILKIITQLWQRTFSKLSPKLPINTLPTLLLNIMNV